MICVRFLIFGGTIMQPHKFVIRHARAQSGERYSLEEEKSIRVIYDRRRNFLSSGVADTIGRNHRYLWRWLQRFPFPKFISLFLPHQSSGAPIWRLGRSSLHLHAAYSCKGTTRNGWKADQRKMLLHIARKGIFLENILVSN